jgi:hypothetical protein|tara:strand:- start:47 stop:361 length:315 start_codon:yes stop_codon:yes gene_type:complete
VRYERVHLRLKLGIPIAADGHYMARSGEYFRGPSAEHLALLATEANPFAFSTRGQRDESTMGLRARVQRTRSSPRSDVHLATQSYKLVDDAAYVGQEWRNLARQ